MEPTDQKSKLFSALCEVQKSNLAAITDADNPHFKSKYATLESVWNVIREPLTKNGLAISQLISMDAVGNLILTTRLMHISGEFLDSVMPIIVDKKTPQAVGSSLTYARRYALSALVGVSVADEDDDAESANESSRSAPAIQPKAAFKPLVKPVEKQSPDDNQAVSQAQLKRLFAIAREQGFTDKEQIRDLMIREIGCESFTHLNSKNYAWLCKLIEAKGDRKNGEMARQERENTRADTDPPHHQWTDELPPIPFDAEPAWAREN